MVVSPAALEYRRSGDGATPQIRLRAYRRIAQLAATTLTFGYSVVADALYGKESERQDIMDVARRGDTVRPVLAGAPSELLEQRITAAWGDASDATVEVPHAQLQFVTTPKEWVHVSIVPLPS